MDTEHFLNHQEIVIQKPCLRKPIAVNIFCIVQWRTICRFGGVFFIHPIYCSTIPFRRVGHRRRYSDWLRAGQSGDRIPVGGEIFCTCPDLPWGPPSLLYNWYRVFTRVKSGRGVTLTPHPLLVLWS